MVYRPSPTLSTTHQGSQTEWIEINSDGEQEVHCSLDPEPEPIEEEPETEHHQTEHHHTEHHPTEHHPHHRSNAVRARAAAARGSSSSCASQEPPGPPATTPTTEDRDTHYMEALDQALELYRLTDPDAEEEQIFEAASRAARLSMLAEARLIYAQLPRRRWPRGWHEVMEEALQQTAANQPTETSEQTPFQMPEVRHTRRRASEQQPPEQDPQGQKTSREERSEASSTLPPPQNRWKRLLARIIERKRWSEKGRALNYSRNGLPRNLDGKARGFGRHLGRWGWPEIRYEW